MYLGEKDAVIKKDGLQNLKNYGTMVINGGGMAGDAESGSGNVDGRSVPRERTPEERDAHRVTFVCDDGRSPSDWLNDRWPATVADAAAVLLSVAVAWCLLRVNVTPELMALPGGSLASIFLMYAVGTAAGRAAASVDGLPPLLGMMVAGIVLQNCGLYRVTDDWCVRLVAVMREAALSVILIKGGLELNAGQLRALSGVVARLAILPCIAEAVAAGTVAHFILPNFSWEWGLALGFTLSAVSPAVLVPNILRLKRLNYGEKTGVNTLVIAASSLDDILSISAFGVLLGIVFSTGDLTNKIVQGPVDVCIGTALGIVWGLVMIIVPPSPWAEIYNKSQVTDQEIPKIIGDRAERSVTAKRSVLLGAGGFLAVTGSQLYGYPGAGPLACIVSAFVAGNGWKRRAHRHRYRGTVPTHRVEEPPREEDPVEKVFERVWFCLQPILFASIGTEIKFELLGSGDTLAFGLLVIGAGLFIRVIITALSVLGAGFSPKEVTFIQIAWLPKATVQAALAPVALEMARNMGTKVDQESASNLLTIAVLSILITAPIGALGIQLFGPMLLSKSNEQNIIIEVGQTRNFESEPNLKQISYIHIEPVPNSNSTQT